MTEKDMLEHLKDILLSLQDREKAEISITRRGSDYEDFTVVKKVKKEPNKGYYNSKKRRNR